MAYVNRRNDPVGPWYEAALPGRSAFCMRDVSHQLVGAQMLGLADINKNLLTKFVSAIAESRDWCGYCPLEFYRHGKSEQAYALLVRLMAPELKRREYPEVSLPSWKPSPWG